MGGQQEAGTRIIEGRALKCPICGNDRFRTRHALMNRRWMAFLDFEWADRQAATEICSRCGHVLWFLADGN